ncbi:PAS domain S-box protein [Arcobacter sp. s6]|uniref:PAS domain S-box protein n=1 Tax=Arcobacter sp. s6 TaxID=3230363 RepID=UPI0034A0844D
MIYALITIIALLFAWFAYRYEKLLAKNNEILENYNDKLENELKKRTTDLLKQKTLLEDSEFRWKFAVEGSGDGLWDWNKKTNEVYFSKRWKNMLGFEEHEIQNTFEEWEKRVHPDDLKQVYIDINNHLEGRTETYENEHRVLCKNGSYKWILDRGIIVQRDGDGKAIRLIGTHTDIDDRKEYQKNIEKTNIKFRSIYDRSLDAIVLYDVLSGKFDDVNPKACELYGYTKSEFLNLGIKNIEVLHDDELIKETQNRMLKQGWDRFESKHKLKNGTIIDVMVNAVSIKLFDKDYIYVSFRDITQQKRLELITLEQKKEFETIFRTIKDGIAIIDLDTNFINCNKAFSDLIAYSKDELLTKKCSDLIVLEDRDKHKAAIEEAIKVGFAENMEKRCINKDGKQITVHTSIALMPDKEHLLLSIRDIANIKLLEEQSKMASMGEMIGNIAHQWRQPLSIISTSASGMKVKSDFGVDLSKKDISDFSDLIIKQTEYLSNTIDNFRDFLKGDKRHFKTNIKDVLEYTFSLISATISNNFIVLIDDIDETLYIDGNKNELSEAFINIINNSKDALKANVKNENERFIFIQARKIENNKVEITFKDNGGGIPNEIINRVFEPYFTSKHKSVGTGLGLSMANKIISERHDGLITVCNEVYEYKGKEYTGACFKVIFEKN